MKLREEQAQTITSQTQIYLTFYDILLSWHSGSSSVHVIGCPADVLC